MPELRRNPLTGGWVAIAPERASRPDTFRAPAPEATTTDGNSACPFCPGNEAMTPPEVARVGDGAANAPGWRVRTVPNLFPIVAGEPAKPVGGATRFHEALRGGGAHEVVILSPQHGRTLADLSGVEIEELFDAVAARIRAHLKQGHAYSQMLVNHGRPAGASIEHPHLQLVSIGIPPPVVANEAQHIAEARECPVCRAVAEDADRTAPLFVAESPAPVWAPWWSGVPFEIMVAPRAHEARFEHASAPGAVARSVGHVLGLLRNALGDVPYNAVLHNSPTANGTDFHWHVHIWPRLTIQAGFEQGTGVLVNQVPPETAAAALRAAGRGAEPEPVQPSAAS